MSHISGSLFMLALRNPLITNLSRMMKKSRRNPNEVVLGNLKDIIEAVVFLLISLFVI